MIESLSIAVHAFVSRVSMSFSVDDVKKGNERKTYIVVVLMICIYFALFVFMPTRFNFLIRNAKTFY